MKLYLDDERPTPDGWERAYSAQECIEKLKTGLVKVVSLDHDLGYNVPTGYDVIKWIEEQVFTDSNYIPPEIRIHTANPSGKDNMMRCRYAIFQEIGRRKLQREV